MSMRLATGAIDHRLFPGKLLKSQLGFGEKVVVASVRAPDGDFRPWDDVMDWALGIADRLRRLDLGETWAFATATPARVHASPTYDE